MYLHTDTETTGLPINGMPSDHPGHPHIVSLTGVLDDSPDEPLGQINTLIKPDGYRTEDFREAFRVHGITTERAQDEGVPLQAAMEEYMALARRAPTFSAFNAHFDFKMLKIACARLPEGNAFREHLETMTSICTMESAADHLLGKKRISLKNAHFELFHEETQTDKFHGSLKDAMASRRIFWELKKRGALLDPKATLRVYDSPRPDVPRASPITAAMVGEPILRTVPRRPKAI